MAKKLKLTANNSSTMYDLAKVFGTTIDELKKYNKLDSNIIKSGQEFYWETDDVEGVKKRLSDLQKYRQTKYEKDKAAYDKEQAAKKKSAQSFKDLHAKDEDYGDLTQHQINDYQNFKKQGLGNSVQDFKAYKEKEHKSAESTKDLTKKAGYGIVGMSAALPVLANPAALSQATKFTVKQLPWMIGSEVANKGLDTVAEDNENSWANNRYIRGAANAIGMTGGNFAGGLIKGASRHGLKYIPRATGALTQNAVGSFGNTLGSMEGMAAMDHLADGMDVQNPYGRAAINTAGMFLGHNANRKLMQKAKEKIGKSINNKQTQTFNESMIGNDVKASQLLNEEQQLQKVLNNSLVSKALDVKGSSTMPTLFSAVEHIPVLGAMEAAAFAEDQLGTDILHNPILQSAMILGAGKTRNKISDIAYKTKKLSGGKGDLAGVVENVMDKKGDFTGTYGTNMVGNGVLKKWFPGMSKEQVTEDMINRKLQSLSPEEKADFIGKGDIGGMRTRAKQSGFDTSKGEKGYIEAEHNKGRNPMFTSGGFAHQGIGQTLPEGFTPEQFYTAVAAKTAGSRHGFGYKYGTMIPKVTEKGDFTKAEFVDSKGNSQPVLRHIGNRYVFNPEFKADAGFRGQDTYIGVKNGNAQWSNVAGHVGTLIRIPGTNGQHSIMKVGIDTPGYGDTAKRYKGASQALGTVLGKGLDYFTPRPQYTVWGEYVNPNGNIFSNTTNVQTGNNSSKVNMRSTPNYMTPTGMIPTQYQTPATLRDHLKFRQQQKAEQSKTPKQQAIRSNAAVQETVGRYNYADRYNKTWGTNFKEGDQKHVFEKMKDVNRQRPDNAMIDPNYYESTLGFMREHNLGLPRMIKTSKNNNNQKSFYQKLNDEYAAYRALKEGY